MDHDRVDHSRLRGSLHLYDDAIVLHRPDNTAYCVDPLDVAAALTDVSFGSGWLPPNTLFYQREGGRERVGLYVPPSRRDVTVNVGGKEQEYDVPFPGLIFVGAGTDYSLFAVRQQPWPSWWPESDETLYLAPTPNVHSGITGVCAGNVPFPIASPATIREALDLFFESHFNRDLGVGKSRRYKTDIIEMWAELDKKRANSYPLDDLIHAGLTLREVINAQ